MDKLRYWLAIIKAAARNWLDSNAFALAGSLAFFTLFSIAPVVIVIVSIIGFFFGEEAAQGQIVVQLQEVIGTEAATAVQNAVARSQLDTGGLWATVAGILAMLLGATTVFGQMQTALNTIWGVVPKPSRNSIFLLLRKRLASLTIVLAIGFVMLCSLSLSVALNALVRFTGDFLPWQETVMRGLEIGVSFLVITSLFAVIFKNLPDVRLTWKDVALGAVVTALLFTLGRSLIALYLTHTATASTFGAAGSVVLLLLWVNYSSLILLFGAAFTRAHLEAEGRSITPRSVAVRVHRKLVEDD
ncbi:MAG: YihY/virulence factor BrkB family protein [Xanthomonadales bacterium]|nr:YihY/virulence factor BrkB family protein [Xanthomonadales bacterium]